VIAVALQALRTLFRRRNAQHAEPKRPEPTADELERDQELLEQVAAGIALNKTPGR
jgi:hypothetical protein